MNQELQMLLILAKDIFDREGVTGMFQWTNTLRDRYLFRYSRSISSFEFSRWINRPPQLSYTWHHDKDVLGGCYGRCTYTSENKLVSLINGLRFSWMDVENYVFLCIEVYEKEKIDQEEEGKERY